MYDPSAELTVILITLWCFQKLRKDWQQVNKQDKSLMWKDLNLRKLNELEVRKWY